jgi:DNA-binding GntR family transcriptional regulator
MDRLADVAPPERSELWESVLLLLTAPVRAYLIVHIVSRGDERMSEAHRDHEAIVQALREGRADEAVDALTRQLRETEESILGWHERGGE